MKELLLSIIVPVYNVETYIERCLRSLLEQQDLFHEEYEVIVINDGSPDNSKAVVERLQPEFPNLVLINQVNQGVSKARNNAIATAKGDYILPVDPDDYIHQNTLGLIYSKAKQSNLDVLLLPYEIVDKDGHKVWKADFDNFSDSPSGPEIYFRTRAPMFKDPDRSWGILYKRSLVYRYKIKYPEDVPYLEDGQFLGQVYSVAKRCQALSIPFYIREERLGSATKSPLFYSDKAANGFIKAAKDMQVFQVENLSAFSEEQYNLTNHIIARFILLTLMPSATKRDVETFKKRVKQLKEAGFVKIDCKGVRRWHRKYAKAYNISPYAFFLIKQVQLIQKLARNKFSIN